MSQAGSGPGWFPDPTGRHEYRFWDGTGWTPVVSDGGVQSQEGDQASPGQPSPGQPGAAQGGQFAAGQYAAGAQYGQAEQYPPSQPYSASQAYGAGVGQYPGGQQAPQYGWAGQPGAEAAMAPAGGAKKRKWLVPAIAVVCVLALVGALVGWRVWSNRGPGVPGEVTATAAGGDTIELTWSAPNGPEVKEYLINRNGEQVGTVPGGTLTYKDSQGLSPADFYTYTVVASANGKQSDPAQTAEVRTQAPAPRDVSVSETTSSVTLEWKAPKGAAQPDSYVIYRDGEQVKSVSGAKTSFKDSGLAPATAYKYAVASLWGARESDRSELLKARTGEPSLGAARLVGDWTITMKMAEDGGGDWPKKGKKWDEAWTFTPKCDTGACTVVVNADVVPEGYAPSPFKITLKRDGATYAGSTVTNITTCRSTKVKNTVVMKLKVAKAGVVGTEWMAQALAGSVIIKSPYTDADGSYYCPAQAVNTTVTGKVNGF